MRIALALSPVVALFGNLETYLRFRYSQNQNCFTCKFTLANDGPEGGEPTLVDGLDCSNVVNGPGSSGGLENEVTAGGNSTSENTSGFGGPSIARR